MDGFCKNNLGRLLSGLFLSVALVCNSALQAQESQRLGLLPVVFATPTPTLSSSPDKILLEALQRRLDAALEAEQSIACVRLDAPHALDLFNADSVRFFCQNHRIEKLFAPSLESSFDQATAMRHHRVQLRWLDAASGEMTKFHVAEFESMLPDTALSGFDASAALRALLEAPELIITQEQQVALLPALRELPAPVVARSKSTRWLWYVSAAAVLSGGSTYWLLHEQKDSSTKRLLPEPPGPPPK